MADKKILILGAAGFPVGVHAYPWDRLPPELNVADFDVVILNLAVFESDVSLRDGINPERLPARGARDGGFLPTSDDKNSPPR